MAKKETSVYEKWEAKCLKNGEIPANLFQELDVKRGLRNQDGSGVLAGLTQIASVVGAKKQDGKLIPVEGNLEYRGINIQDLVTGIRKEKRFGFEEVTYLLLFGELPTRAELDEFSALFYAERDLPKDFVRDIILPFPAKDIMNTLARCTLALYCTDENANAIQLPYLIRQSVNLVTKFPVFTAYAYVAMQHHFYGKPLFIRKPDPKLSTAENFLYLIRETGAFTDLEAKVLDVLLVLHAEHGGGNNSTFAARVVSSSATDSYSAIAAAVGSLKGPLHGGANISVMRMMDDIQANVKDWKSKSALKQYLTKILKKEAGDKSGKVYGFGHAVYTKSDPRAILLKDYATELAQQKGREKELALYFLMEDLVPEVFYEFKGNDKVVAPNVDFYSGFVYDCLGIPADVYTPLFAVARVVGWMAHRIEELVVCKRIIRPSYKAVTEKHKYTPIKSR